MKPLANALTDLPVRHYPSFDGEEIAYREIGEGRPLVLIHGYFSTAATNWIRYGHAERIAAAGHRVIMPDLRAHGDSTRSHDPAAYPHDALADDGLALVAHLGLADYDLGGYSLGGRTTARMLVRGAAPRRAIIAGMGLRGLLDVAGRSGLFRRVLTQPGTFERGSIEWASERFLKTVGGDPQALLLVLDTFIDTPRAALSAIATPVLVMAGIDDQDNGPAEDLADLLPNAVFRSIPGNHMSAVTQPELADAIIEYLASE